MVTPEMFVVVGRRGRAVKKKARSNRSRPGLKYAYISRVLLWSARY
jgi:hypothetical protein